ncbi:MAG: hypothetical protein HQK77_18590 [Desulfobacterales bacterium]|nr:hypothetical protein [Desulfobacterales bacterium]
MKPVLLWIVVTLFVFFLNLWFITFLLGIFIICLIFLSYKHKKLTPNLHLTLLIICGFSIGLIVAAGYIYSKDDAVNQDNMLKLFSTFVRRLVMMNSPAYTSDFDLPVISIYEPGNPLLNTKERLHTDFAIGLYSKLSETIFKSFYYNYVIVFSLFLIGLISCKKLFIKWNGIQILKTHDPMTVFCFLVILEIATFGLYSFFSNTWMLPLTGIPFPLLSSGEYLKISMLTQLFTVIFVIYET